MEGNVKKLLIPVTLCMLFSQSLIHGVQWPWSSQGYQKIQEAPKPSSAVQSWSKKTQATLESQEFLTAVEQNNTRGINQFLQTATFKDLGVLLAAINIAKQQGNTALANSISKLIQSPEFKNR